MVVSKQVNSIRKDRVSQKLIFKTKGTYRVLKKATPISYWLQRLYFCEGLGSPVRKLMESTTSMEKIPFTMVLHKNVYGEDTISATMSVTFVSNPMENVFE